MEFEITWVKGIPVINSEGFRFVIDTGSPSSIMSSVGVSWLPPGLYGRVGLGGLDAVKLSRLLGERVHGLFGADVLGKFMVEFDFVHHQLRLMHQLDAPEGRGLPIELLQGVPVLMCEIDGRTRRCFIDTGAKTNYGTADLIRDHRPNGQCEDFHPVTGPYRTSTHRVLSKIGDEAATDREFLLATSAIGQILERAGVDGIIGCSWMREHDSMVLSYAKLVVTFERTGAL